MKVNASAPWHKESFNRFIKERLPELLTERLPLAGYHVESTGTYTCKVHVTTGRDEGTVEIEYPDVPQPDDEGRFEIEGRCRVVVPMASQEELDKADVLCVGEQLYAFIEARLGEVPQDMLWDEPLARAWLPLDKWVNEFLRDGVEWHGGQSTAQDLDQTNWLSVRAHLRRLVVLNRERVFTPGHFGRTCPLETPEGPNIGRILSVASGAEIRDGKLVIVDERPEATLGLSALMVPFLEHNDANRQLMGCNMMRQWQVPLEPEPALVQSGYEPDEPGFWCGVNLLTAFVSWGVDTYEDGIVISESAAKRFKFEHPVESGDKISNRHGTKGVIGRILPDDEMPHLDDDTPVELAFSFVGCHTRRNFGQIREAIMGRVARAEGRPAIVPPFRAPGAEEIRERLVRARLPESGMEILTLGRNGKPLLRPSTAGWVYWGRIKHDVRNIIHASVSGRPQVQGELEYLALREAGAFENVLETFNTRSALRGDAETLAERVSAGPVEQAAAPTPAFAELVKRLRAAGIRAGLDGETVIFECAPPDGATLELARPVPHPWLHSELGEVGVVEESPAYRALAEANARAERLAASDAPESLRRKAVEQLERRVKEFFDMLVRPEHVWFSGSTYVAFWLGATVGPNRVLFSGRSVIAPGAALKIDQLGVPDQIAWELFGPLAARELGTSGEVDARSERAAQVLDSIMARSWVILNRAPTILPTNLLGFHPVRVPERVVRIHPLICAAMNADFDGDQAVVLLPVTEAGQREVGERLSVAAHLRRDPALIRWFCPSHATLWGLASLSLTAEGREKISEAAGIEVAAPESFVTRSSVVDAVQAVLQRDGVDEALEALDRLMRLGFEVALESGASMNPFIGASLERPPEPACDDPDAWNAHAEEIAERIASRTDFADDDFGAQLLAVKSGARGGIRHLARLLGSPGAVHDIHGEPVAFRHGFSDGLSPTEMFAHVVGAREGLARMARDVAQSLRAAYGAKKPVGPQGFHVLARAMRATRPGIVFARAAVTGEADPLTDLDSRLFVGLLPLGLKRG